MRAPRAGAGLFGLPGLLLIGISCASEPAAEFPWDRGPRAAPLADGGRGPRRPSREPPAGDEPGSGPAASPAPRPGAEPPAAGQRSREVAEIVRRLQMQKTAEETFWDLTEVEERLIPDLIREIESEEPTAVETLKILVLDKDFVGHAKAFEASRVPGLGAMEEIDEEGNVVSRKYTKMAYNIAPNQKGYKVVIDKFGGFPLGVVLRAALLNRFRSPRYPAGLDAAGNLPLWWQSYYHNVFGGRRAAAGKTRP